MPNRIDKIILDKPDVNLSNADNTSDVNKPISTAQAAALAAKVDKTTTVNGKALSGNISITATDVGLGNVNNTSDANKPVSTAQATAIAAKVDKTTTVNGKALSGNISITATDVGLGNVNNTSDANKPVSTAQAAALANKQDKTPYLDSYLQPYAGIRFKNIIQNPKMLVSQRGDTITLPIDTTLGTVDRFNVGNSTTARGTVRRITTGAQLDGYDSVKHWIRVTPNTTVVAYPIQSRKHMRIAQCVETMECRQLYGVPTTLSFLVKSSVAGVFSVAFRNGARNKTYISEYTIKAAGVAQVVEVKLPASLIADLQIDWADDTGAGVEICWPTALATDLKTSVVNSVVNGDFLGGPNFNSSWGASTSDYFDITMVQWEVGTNRTSFEHRPFSIEFLLCSRYLVGVDWATGQSSTMAIGGFCTGSAVVCSVPLPCTLRGDPIWVGGTLMFNYATRSGVLSSVGVQDMTIRGNSFLFVSSNGIADGLVGGSGYLSNSGVTTGFRGWSAELI